MKQESMNECNACEDCHRCPAECDCDPEIDVCTNCGRPSIYKTQSSSCPHCGSLNAEASWIAAGLLQGYSVFAVVCSDCNARGPEVEYRCPSEGESAARRQWRERVVDIAREQRG
jgi:RNA polymerase subunit RPABC4/transcription elongation factor Spt4